MWGSAIVGDVYDAPAIIGDDFTKSVYNTLTQHPHYVHQNIPIKKDSTLFSNEEIKSYGFPKNGDGWLEATYGKDANSIIRMCRKMRRNDKSNRDMIDAIIDDVRTIKAMEVEATINNLSWSDGLQDTIRYMGLSDRSLKSLRKFGETRSTGLQQACQMFLKASSVLSMLNELDNWGVEEQENWVDAMQMRKDAQKMWRGTLHQIDSISKDDKATLEFVSKQLEENGELSSREIVRRGVGVLHKSTTPSKVGMLIKMYGEELDIYRAHSRGLFVKMGTNGLIIKDIWAYAAGFLDADGSIFISERGEPRATFVATGDRGKDHCENLHKALGCGRLVLNQKVHKNSNRSLHRLVFQSKDDLRQLLKGILPHLKMKSLQAKAVLSFIDSKDKLRKDELQKLVTFNNWKDDKKKADNLLSKWGLDADTIGGFAEGL
tara:strand:- start:1361 stop:2659 length:1299 start_codon:yes stop_codon:yes gene_type:complete